MTPSSFHGAHYGFDGVVVEPKPWRPDGVRLWFGGSARHPRLLRRLVRHGHGLNPLGPLADADLKRVRTALRDAGRDPAGLELVGGVRGRFRGPDAVADLDEALAAIPAQAARGFGSICLKPSQFLDDRAAFASWCRDVVARVDAL